MPTTYNGIGTHYYGKKNHSVRNAICRACHNRGILESYDTRLWFVIVFIPLIPLGRKRIIDSCSNCTRHFAADATKYEQARQLQTSGNMDRYRRSPSPQAALEAHAGLLAFHEHDQATDFRTSALAAFPDHAGLLAGLASQLDEVLEYQDAARLFGQALALDPDLPEARVGIALRQILAGELAEARQLLDFLEAPGSGQIHRLGPLDTLAQAYQSNCQHEEALVLAAALLRELPSVGQMHAFRTFVVNSERALRRPGSILPRRQHSLGGLLRKSGSSYAPWMRKATFGGIALLLLMTGLGINNWYIKNHRTIRVINVTGGPVKVEVDGGPAAEISIDGNLTVPEGHHRLHLTGPVEESHEVDLHSDYFARWTSQPVWILNPGGEAAFDEATVFYAKNPQPSQHNLIIGRPFIALSHVDYAFVDPPQSMRMEKGAGSVTKTALSRVPLSPVQTFFELLRANREAALNVAERHLRQHPDFTSMLEAYVENFAITDQGRVTAFLGAGLDRRPVEVAWHRAYQSVAGMKEGANPIARYDGYLASAPDDARLLYLRGRIDQDDGRQDYYQRSIKADPKLPWPWLALGVQAGGRAKWDESIRCLRKAIELGIAPELVADPLHVARLALISGPDLAMVDEYRKEMMAKPDDLKPLMRLCDALATSGLGDEIPGAIQTWINMFPIQAQSTLRFQLLPLGYYMAGRFDKGVDEARSSRAPGSESILAQGLLASGRLNEVVDRKGSDQFGEDPGMALAISLGLMLDGREEEATSWRERGVKKLAAGPSELRTIARILGATEPPPVAELERLSIDPSVKALTCAILAGRFPARRAEYNAEAARFNIRRLPPYELVRRAIAGPQSKTP